MKSLWLTRLGSLIGRGWDFLTEEKHVWRFHALAGIIPFAPWLVGANDDFHRGNIHGCNIDLIIGFVFWLLYFVTNFWSDKWEALAHFTVFSVILSMLVPVFIAAREKARHEQERHSRPEHPQAAHEAGGGGEKPRGRPRKQKGDSLEESG